MSSGESGDTKRNRETNENNYKMNAENNETNLSIANANLDLQREQQQYERDLQQQIFQREDTAIQRQVSDSRAAGISPLANLSGSQTAGTSVATTTPQNGFQSTASRDQAPPPQNMQTLNTVMQIIGGINQAAQTLNTLQNGVADRYSQSLSNLALQQQMSFDASSWDDRLDAIKLSNSFTKANTYKTWYQGANEYGKAQDFATRRDEYNRFGILPSDDNKTRMLKKVITMLSPNGQVRTKQYNFGPNGPSVDYVPGKGFDRKDLDQFAKDWLGIDPSEYQQKGVDWLQSITREQLGSYLKQVLDLAGKSLDEVVKDGLDSVQKKTKTKAQQRKDYYDGQSRHRLPWSY